MTNFQSVQKQSITMWQEFIVVRCANNCIDGVKFIVCSAIPDILPLFKQSLETRGKNSEAGSFMLVTGKQRAALAVVSALSLPGIFTWLGIQQNSIVFTSIYKVCIVFDNFKGQIQFDLEYPRVSSLDIESEKIMNFCRCYDGLDP